jgi:hypothetical protein
MKKNRSTSEASRMGNVREHAEIRDILAESERRVREFLREREAATDPKAKPAAQRRRASD